MDKGLSGWGTTHLPSGRKDTWASSKGMIQNLPRCWLPGLGHLAGLVGDVRKGQLGWPSSHFTCKMPRESGLLLRLQSLITEATHRVHTPNQLPVKRMLGSTGGVGASQSILSWHRRDGVLAEDA